VFWGFQDGTELEAVRVLQRRQALPATGRCVGEEKALLPGNISLNANNEPFKFVLHFIFTINVVLS